MTHRLFGTDGVRGRAFEPPLDEQTVRRLGAALGHWLGPAPGRVLIGGDTRSSTATLAGWVSESLHGVGAQVVWGGTLPTPAVAHLLRTDGFAAGVVISASHNAAHDNGIKVLGPGGQKIDEQVERRLEEMAAELTPSRGAPLPAESGTYAERYLDLVRAALGAGHPLGGVRLVVDAAHGAASALAGPLFASLGARVTVVNDAPDGTNINDRCGATSPGEVAGHVARLKADAGLALDGDADRSILIDETGGVVDGDDILLAWGRELKRRGQLPGNTVVGTVMANFGLERTLARDGIELLRSAVGDRNVWSKMKSVGAALGGEPSGHIICAHHTVTGDGLLTGAAVLAIAVERGVPLSRLSNLQRTPQVLHNIPVSAKPPFSEVPELSSWVEAVSHKLGDHGRLLLRYSGTEPLARIMVEGDDRTQITAIADEGRTLIHRLLGPPDSA